MHKGGSVCKPRDLPGRSEGVQYIKMVSERGDCGGVQVWKAMSLEARGNISGPCLSLWAWCVSVGALGPGKIFSIGGVVAYEVAGTQVIHVGPLNEKTGAVLVTRMIFGLVTNG